MAYTPKTNMYPCHKMWSVAKKEAERAGVATGHNKAKKPWWQHMCMGLDVSHA